jgi:hypothetical protein
MKVAAAFFSFVLMPFFCLAVGGPFTGNFIILNAGLTNIGSAGVDIHLNIGTGPPYGSPIYIGFGSGLAPGVTYTIPYGGLYDNRIAGVSWTAAGDPPGTWQGTNGAVSIPSQDGGSVYLLVYPNGTNHCIPFPATVHNSSAGTVVAYWIQGGVTMFTTSLAPGMSYTYIYPCVDPTGLASCNWGYNLNPPVFGTDGNGNPISGNTPNDLNPGGAGNGNNLPGGGGGGTGGDAGAPPTQGTNGIGTNAPIIWGNLTNDNSLVDAAGFSILHADNQQMLLAMNAQIQQLQIGQSLNSNGYWFDGMWIQTNNNTTAVGLSNVVAAVESLSSNGAASLSSNVWVQNWPSNTISGTNLTVTGLSNVATETTLQGVTNLLGLIQEGQTNGSHLTNGMSLDTNWIGGVSAAGAALASSVQSGYGSLSIASVQPSVTGGGSGATTLGVATMTMTLDTSHVPGFSLLGYAKTIASFLVFLFTFAAMVKYTQESITRVINQRQVQGNLEMIEGLGFGGNLDVVTGAMYLAIIASALLAIPVATATVLLTMKGDLHDPSGAFAALASVAGGFPWAVVTQAFPLEACIVCFFQYFLYRYILMWPACFLARSIILLMIA